MVKFTRQGDFSKTYKYLHKLWKFRAERILNKYGQKGVSALQAATPKDTGLTAGSWDYSIEFGEGRATITWTNSNMAKGWFNVAVGLQYGHGTRNGGWVEGTDYINPAMRPIFDAIAKEAFEEVMSG